MARRIAGSADSPTIMPLISQMIVTATTTSSTPTLIEPSASNSGLPVSIDSSTATNASTRPPSAAMSSPATTISSDWRVSRNQRQKRSPRLHLADLAHRAPQRDRLEHDGHAEHGERDRGVAQRLG